MAKSQQIESLKIKIRGKNRSCHKIKSNFKLHSNCDFIFKGSQKFGIKKQFNSAMDVSFMKWYYLGVNKNFQLTFQGVRLCLY